MDRFQNYFPSRNREDRYRQFLGYPGAPMAEVLGAESNDGADGLRKAAAPETHVAYQRRDPRTGKLEQVRGTRVKAVPVWQQKAAAFCDAVDAAGIDLTPAEDPEGEASGRDVLASALHAVFGDAIPSFADLQSAYAGPEGFSAEITDLDLEPHILGLDQFAFTVKMYDEAGVEVATMQRTFERQRGKVVIQHDEFKVDPAFQGKRDIGKTVLRNSIKWYKDQGYGEVNVQANGEPPVGRYVWASFGYQWDAETASQKKIALSNYLEVEKGLKPKQVRAVMREIKTPWDIADLKINDERVGKEFLMQDVTWNGTLTLKDGHSSFERARERLGF